MDPLDTLEACQYFIRTQPARRIADRLLHDQSICRERSGVPSLLAHCLPSRSDEISEAISGDTYIPLAVARMRYSSIISGIKSHLATLGSQERPSEIPTHLVPNDLELKAALKVLHYIQLPHMASPDKLKGIGDITGTIQAHLDLGASLRQSNIKRWHNKYCYICRYAITVSHRLYPALCHPCAEFNISACSLSLSSNLDLQGKIAIVTGGRINLGYHIALRLLRCGASVIVSSRYPLDAEERYLAEHDVQEWKNRLKIVGADFRTAKDVFALVKSIRNCLISWKAEYLDILINNAAQTLTDSYKKEEQTVNHELFLLQGHDPKTSSVVSDTDYIPRVRGGQVTAHLEGPSATRLLKGSTDPNASTEEVKTSWIQEIGDIPYEDVITAHSVNALVPFILIRELLPIMRCSKAVTGSDADSISNVSKSPLRTSKPASYIVNVSSREGLFEATPHSSAKSGRHVHTNMSKAALNMITETEAVSAWKRGKVAINSVDPGFMSADPVWMEMVSRKEQKQPLAWEDGAGRVLWPIAKGEGEGIAIWGRFLKHFTEININK